MVEPIWILLEVAEAAHRRQLAEHGGVSGTRDDGLLISALNRPLNTFQDAKGAVSIPKLAAIYAFGISKNHPFLDGNKRTSLVISLMFLRINHWQNLSSQEELFQVFTELSDGSMGEVDLISWFESSSLSIPI